MDVIVWKTESDVKAAIFSVFVSYAYASATIKLEITIGEKCVKEAYRHIHPCLLKKRKTDRRKNPNCPPSAALFKMRFYISVWWCCTAGVAVMVPNSNSPQQANNHPVICTCSNYYPISNKYRTITGRNPHTQAAAGCKNPGREQLARSSDGSDQTAINQQRKHLSMRRMLTESQHLWL